jgi:hypothetical protein
LTTTLTFDLNLAWVIAVPKHAEFTQPSFHFGERVKWVIEVRGNRRCLTGRIRGCWFCEAGFWEYFIKLDINQSLGLELEDFVFLQSSQLSLVNDSDSLRNPTHPMSEWLNTREAARRLGVSQVQLRKLRLSGLLESGYHCRNTSVPGSSKPRWQWHLERCHQALIKPSSARLD